MLLESPGAPPPGQGGETRRFERDLVRQEVAQALGEELAMRQILADLPQTDMPEALLAQIQDAVVMEAAADDASGAAQEKRSWLSLPEVPGLSSVAWMWRGPALAVENAGPALRGASEAAGGLSTVRYTAGRGPGSVSESQGPSVVNRVGGKLARDAGGLVWRNLTGQKKTSKPGLLTRLLRRKG